jgi:uncharacterized protein YbaR (Trm112 family)
MTLHAEHHRYRKPRRNRGAIPSVAGMVKEPILPVMASSHPIQTLDEETISILRCPVSGSRMHLDPSDNCLVCEVGGLRYPVRDGIPVLLPEEAKLPPEFETLEDFRKKFGRLGG